MKSMEEDLNEAYQKQHELQKQFEEERKRILGKMSQMSKENSVLKAENEMLERKRKDSLDQEYANIRTRRESTGSKLDHLNQTIEKMPQLTKNSSWLQAQNSTLTQELAVAKGDIANKNREVEL